MSQNWRIPQWFPSVGSKALGQLESYSADLSKWTKKINLISPGTLDEADRIHFADAILGLGFFMEELKPETEIYDLGSGNGIPGVVLAILRPDLRVCCLDSDERKIGFLKQLGLRVELDNLRTLCSRLENVGAQSISIATARGFAPLKKGLALAGAQFSPGSSIYHFKGQEFQSELSEIPIEVKKIWETRVIGEYKLPEDGGTRAILKSKRV